MRRSVRRLIYVSFALAVFVWAASLRAQSGDRVIAIADVHGDLDALVAILQKTGLIDQSRQWSGGRATLVQTGDMIDRGPKSRAVLDFLMALQKEAPRRNGTVRIGLGNHEVMNMMGDMRYVVAEDYAAFADARSEQRRRTAFQNLARLQSSQGQAANEAAWMEAHPPGFVEQREAFGPQGVYGRWLRGLPAINQVGDSIFLHGGLTPELAELAEWKVDKINTSIRTEIQAFDQFKQYMVDKKLALPFFTLDELLGAAQADLALRKAKPPAEQDEEERQRIQILQQFLGIGSWLTVRDEGPLWFRGYDRWSDQEGQTYLDRLTEALKVKRIVVGHTPQQNGEIRSRFGGKVFLIDGGMLSAYFKGGKAAALEIAGSRVRAIYLSAAVELN